MGKKKVAEQASEKLIAEQSAVDAAVTKAASLRKSKRIESGRIYVNSSYNNTVVTFTDLGGNVLGWATAGALGFSGPKKATPFAATKVVAVIAEKAKNIGMKDIEVVLKGVGGGRDSAVRSLINHGFNISSLKDATPIPHNGPKPRKVRRV